MAVHCLRRFCSQNIFVCLVIFRLQVCFSLNTSGDQKVGGVAVVKRQPARSNGTIRCTSKCPCVLMPQQKLFCVVSYFSAKHTQLLETAVAQLMCLCVVIVDIFGLHKLMLFVSTVSTTKLSYLQQKIQLHNICLCLSS